MNIWRLVSLLTVFVVVTSSRWIMTTITNLHAIAGEENLYFRHPTFQTFSSFLIELTLFAIMIAVPALMRSERKRHT